MEPSASRQLRSPGWMSELITRVRAIDPHAIDVLVALGLTAAALATLVGRIGDENEYRDVDFLAAVLILLQTLPLAVRRMAPIGVLVVITVGIVTFAAMGYETVDAGTFASLVAVYGAASLTDTRRGILAAAITLFALTAFFVTTRGDYGTVDMLVTYSTWAMGWFLGTYVRVRGEQADEAGALAERLERDQEMRAREAVADERARMARELHDIVGHALNLIVIQASGARRVFDSRPQVARDSLTSIETAGREALSDMERMLGVLRAAEGDGEGLGPQPGLNDVHSLAAQVSEAGLPVEVTFDGDALDLPASVELSGYRIVQEALTNSLKHSGASSAKVAIRYRPDCLEVEVADDGRGSSNQRSGDGRGGRGLIGMRERVALFGGELRVGPTPAGGYRVYARLPVKGAAG